MSYKKTKPHYLGHRARLLKRVLQHLSYVEEYELLEILLTRAQPRKDLKSQAKSILQRTGSIRGMINKPTDYEDIEGIGASLSWYCSFLTEVARRYAIQNEHVSSTHDTPLCCEGSHGISSFTQVKEYLEQKNIYASEQKDYIIYMDIKKEIIAMEECTFVEENLSFVAHILKIKPAGIIVVRKIEHEMYILRKEDVEILKKREESLSLFGIVLLDYIICTSHTMVSLQQYSVNKR